MECMKIQPTREALQGHKGKRQPNRIKLLKHLQKKTGESNDALSRVGHGNTALFRDDEREFALLHCKIDKKMQRRHRRKHRLIWTLAELELNNLKITNDIMAEVTGIPPQRTSAYLKDFSEKGIIDRHREKKKYVYSLNNDYLIKTWDKYNNSLY